MYIDDVVLQVETFGAMAKTEKIAFNLEQVWCHFYLLFRNVWLIGP